MNSLFLLEMEPSHLDTWNIAIIAKQYFENCKRDEATKLVILYGMSKKSRAFSPNFEIFCGRSELIPGYVFLFKGMQT